MILDVKRVLAACAVVEFFFILPLFLGSYDAAGRAAVVSNNYFLLIDDVPGGRLDPAEEPDPAERPEGPARTWPGPTRS